MAFKTILKAIVFAGVLALAPAASAQTAGAPLQVRTGEVYTIDITYTQSTEFGGQDIEAVIRQVYALHIVDAENRLWRYVPVSLTYELPDGLGEGAPELDWDATSDALSAFLRIATDIGFDCRVDEYGRCIELTNWRVWSDRIENMILVGDAIARMAPAPAAAPSVTPENDGARSKPTSASEDSPTPAAPQYNWQTIRGPMLQGLARLLDNYDSRDAAAAIASIYMPAFIQGRSLTRRQDVSLVDEYEMPFGAPPLRFNSTLRLERIDQRNNTATIIRRSTLDPASTRESARVITAFISDTLIEPVAAVAGGEEPPTVEAIQQVVEPLLSALTYEETTTGIVDLSTGMARETTTDLVIRFEGMGGTESGGAMDVRGRMVTRVSPGAPNVPRLPRP